ncbi:hypothetical protein [Butyrivibrio sp. JL13D10]|uniref:hypothetical protein n=1 Tax=Butyrivibrio sp. JL13D10 TaxID=3236815 RepID=UPI0038B621A0
MSYFIAVASTDDINVDLTFGAAEGFSIYEVDGTSYRKIEYRKVAEETQDEAANKEESESISAEAYGDAAGGCSANDACGAGNGLGVGNACGSGNGTGEGNACGSGNGCGTGGGCGHGGALPKVELISDCRSLVCRKIGFQAQKQLEKKQIASFDVACSVDEALTKISSYFDKLDNHKPFRRA